METLNQVSKPKRLFTVFKTVFNQVDQRIDFLTNDSEMDSIIACIDGVYFDTGFYDYNDFYPNSDYLPILINNKVIYYFDA